MNALMKQDTGTGLARYDAARYALQAAVAVDEVKDIRDKALAMAAYAKQAGDSQLIEMATEIRVRAERKAGEMLAAMPKATGAKGVGPIAVTSDYRNDGAATLAELGVTKAQSSRWQKLAAVPEAQFEQAVAAAKEVAGEVTARAVIEHRKHSEPAKPRKPEPAQEPEGFDGPDLAALVDELQTENTRLAGVIKASEADDLKAEAIKWRTAYDRALASQSEAMDAAARSEKREKFTMRQLMRCGKAVGEDDPRNIAAKVEAMARAKACK